MAATASNTVGRVVPMPCTAATGRCSDARDYNVELAECCRAHVVTLMRTTADFLNSIRATWWADYGTLLGAVRNPMTTWADYPWLRQTGRVTAGPAPGIVPHDKDADLGVMFESWDQASRKFGAWLSNRCFHLHQNRRRRSLKARLSWKNHTNVDVFFWKQRPGGMMFRDVYASVDRFKGKEFPISSLLPLSTVEWEGLILPAPRDPEAFLEMRYGPKWRTPMPSNNDGVPR
jgi:hypothetical protein